MLHPPVESVPKSRNRINSPAPLSLTLPPVGHSAESFLRPLVVVFPLQSFDDDLCVAQARDLTLVTKMSVEQFDIGILVRVTGLNEE